MKQKIQNRFQFKVENVDILTDAYLFIITKIQLFLAENMNTKNIIISKIIYK